MKNRLVKKLVGFQKAPRARFKWLHEKSLSQEEFLLYELGVAITDWDENHTETYGSFLATTQELAEILGWDSDTTAGRYKKRLIKKKLFTPREDKRIEPKGFEKWQIRKRKNNAEKQKDRAQIQQQDADLQEDNAKKKELLYQTPDYSLISSKDNLSLSPSYEYLGEGELEDIAHELEERDNS